MEKKIGLIEGVVRAKRSRRLPVVLTKDEVKIILKGLEGPSWLMAMLLYGGGLRLMECCRLRIRDVDFSRNQIVIRAGKGDKDRYTMLRSLFNSHFNVISNRSSDNTITTYELASGESLPNALDRKYPNAAKEWGWQPATCHTLRHSFATHLLENGYDIRTFRSCWVTKT